MVAAQKVASLAGVFRGDRISSLPKNTIFPKNACRGGYPKRCENEKQRGGWGRGWEWGFPPIYFSLPPFFFLRSLTSRRTPLSERLHEGTTAKTKKQERRKSQNVFVQCNFTLRIYLCCSLHDTKDVHTVNVPRAPAMNPKIKAFSARLTRFAFLNISWAANIWSLWKRKENEKTLFPVYSHKQS